jgi:vacuolar protein sorting-associated protein 52
MDNATAEYAFVTAFFSYDATVPTGDSSSMMSPAAFISPDQGTFTEQRSLAGSDYGGQRIQSAGMASTNGLSVDTAQKEVQATIDALWKQIMGPVLGYCEVCTLLLHFNVRVNTSA